MAIASGPPPVATPVGVAVLIAALTAGTVAQGAYYAPGRVLVAALVGGAALTVARARRRVPSGVWPVPLACAALAGWTLLRGWNAVAFGTSVAAVATLGGVATAVLVLWHTGPTARERCAGAAIGTGVLVALTAWLGVALRLPSFAVPVEHRLWRGGATLTYPNAAAALLVPLALLALALLVTRRPTALCGGAVYVLLVGVGAALSRAGFLALLAGFALLAGLVGVRTAVRHTAPVALGAAFAVGALAPSFPAASAEPRPLLATAGLLAGAAVAVGLPRLPGRVRDGGLALLLTLGTAAAWTQLDAGYLRPLVASRGNLDSSGRAGAARAALALIAEHPLVGAGVGPARFVWDTPDGNALVALYAHNEYLQVLVDLGAIGALLLAALVAAIGVSVRRGHAYPHRPGVRAGAIAGLAAFAAHSGFDFLWHIAVLPLLAGLLIGLAGGGVPDDGRSGEPPHQPHEGSTT
jgi:hypothetical protein